MSDIRVDKWLWSVRVFKTRSIATDACKMNRVRVNGQLAKASRMLKVGDVVSVRKPPIEYSFRVLRLLSSRVGAKLVPEYMEHVTPKEQYDILEQYRLSQSGERAKGLGRPTKKERRDIEQFMDDMPDSLEFFDWDEDWDEAE